MKFFTIVVLICLSSCKEADSKKSETDIKNTSRLETSPRLIKNLEGEIYIVIIPFEKPQFFTPSTLSDNEIKTISKILPKAVRRMNSEIRRDAERYSTFSSDTVDLKNYIRQYSAYLNKSGQKEVLINCLCRYPDDSWKVRIVSPDGGGHCFFMGTINLSTGQINKFAINAPM